MNFLDDLFRSSETDQIAENPWSDGRAPSVDIPSGDLDNLIQNPWNSVKSDF